jgi:hypothetical protein
MRKDEFMEVGVGEKFDIQCIITRQETIFGNEFSSKIDIALPMFNRVIENIDLDELVFEDAYCKMSLEDIVNKFCKECGITKKDIEGVEYLFKENKVMKIIKILERVGEMVDEIHAFIKDKDEENK